jgi:hypothetical protein
LRHAKPPPGARTPRPASDRRSVRGVSRTVARYGCDGLGSRPVPRVSLPNAGRCSASPPLAREVCARRRPYAVLAMPRPMPWLGSLGTQETSLTALRPVT